MKLERVTIAGTNPTKDLKSQAKIKAALAKIAAMAKRILGHDVEFDFAYDAAMVSPTSCDLLLVVGREDERTSKTIAKYRSFCGKGDARMIDLTSRYDLPEQLYVAYLAWCTKQNRVQRFAA